VRKERVVPALVQDDEPLDEGQGEDGLFPPPRGVRGGRSARRYPENSRGPDGSCRQGRPRDSTGADAGGSTGRGRVACTTPPSTTGKAPKAPANRRSREG